MSAWNPTGRPFPWRNFDPDAITKFTFDFAEYVTLSGPNLTLATCTVEDASPLLDIDGPSIDGNVVTIEVKRSAEVAKSGASMPFTLRPVLSDGQQNDWTRLLILREN